MLAKYNRKQKVSLFDSKPVSSQGSALRSPSSRPSYVLWEFLLKNPSSLFSYLNVELFCF